MHAYAYIHACIAYTHTYIHTYIHTTYIHTYIHMWAVIMYVRIKLVGYRCDGRRHQVPLQEAVSEGAPWPNEARGEGQRGFRRGPRCIHVCMYVCMYVCRYELLACVSRWRMRMRSCLTRCSATRSYCMWRTPWTRPRRNAGNSSPRGLGSPTYIHSFIHTTHTLYMCIFS